MLLLQSFLEHIRAQRLPSELLDILDSASIKFYDGCLIVQVHNHRVNQSLNVSPNLNGDLPLTPKFSSNRNFSNGSNGPSARSGLSNHQNTLPNPNGANLIAETKGEIYRLVLTPTIEALWSDLSLLFKNDFTTEEFLEIESKILEFTTPALCLDPSFEVSRIANYLLNETMVIAPEEGTGSVGGKKRKVNHRDESQEEREAERVREKRAKEMRLMDESYGRPFTPTYVFYFPLLCTSSLV